jgi:hypothetical protein
VILKDEVYFENWDCFNYELLCRSSLRTRAKQKLAQRGRAATLNIQLADIHHFQAGERYRRETHLSTHAALSPAQGRDLAIPSKR